jgi:replicative DNA helicase
MTTTTTDHLSQAAEQLLSGDVIDEQAARQLAAAAERARPSAIAAQLADAAQLIRDGRNRTPEALANLRALCDEHRRCLVGAEPHHDAAAVAQAVTDGYAAALESPDGRYSTGIPLLDEYGCGLWPHWMTVITGPTGVSKSMMANSMALHHAQTTASGVVIFSLELDRRTIGGRLIAALSLQAHRAGEDDGHGYLTVDEIRSPRDYYPRRAAWLRSQGRQAPSVEQMAERGRLAVGFYAERLSRLPLIIVDAKALTAAEIAARTSAIAAEFAADGVPLELLVVDTLTRLSVQGRGGYAQELAGAVGRLEQVAAEEGVHLILVCQQSKDGARNGVKLHTVRETSAATDGAWTVVGLSHADDNGGETNPDQVRAELLKTRSLGAGRTAEAVVNGRCQVLDWFPLPADPDAYGDQDDAAAPQTDLSF